MGKDSLGLIKGVGEPNVNDHRVYYLLGFPSRVYGSRRPPGTGRTKNLFGKQERIWTLRVYLWISVDAYGGSTV